MPRASTPTEPTEAVDMSSMTNPSHTEPGIPPLPISDPPMPYERMRIFFEIPEEIESDPEMVAMFIAREIPKVMGLDAAQWRRITEYHAQRAVQELRQPQRNSPPHGTPTAPTYG